MASRFLTKKFDPQTANDDTTFSEAIDLTLIDGFCVQSIWTGTSIQGDIALQCSLDKKTWEDISGSSVAIQANGDIGGFPPIPAIVVIGRFPGSAPCRR